MLSAGRLLALQAFRLQTVSPSFAVPLPKRRLMKSFSAKAKKAKRAVDYASGEEMEELTQEAASSLPARCQKDVHFRNPR